MRFDIKEIDFEFDEIILNQLRILNTVLDNLAKLPVFENDDFIIDKDSAGTFFLRIKLSNLNKGTIPIDILLEGDGLRLDILYLSETFEWSRNQISSDKANIIKFFQQLLTSYILIESCGSSQKKSRMYLFDETGHFIEKYVLRGFIHNFSGWDCDKQLFFPYYFK